MDRRVLIRMLQRKQELRDSDDVQRDYDAHAVPPNAFEDQLQIQVLREFGFAHAEIEGGALGLYRLTNCRFPDDAELRATVVYLCADESSPGILTRCDAAPDATLPAADGSACSLLSLQPADGQMLVVSAGSGS